MSERGSLKSPHGMRSRYLAGCRCDDCRTAHVDYIRARRAKSLTEGTLSHGRSSTYDAGCRCDKCYAARRVKYMTNGKEYRPKTGRRVIGGSRRSVAPDGHSP